MTPSYFTKRKESQKWDPLFNPKPLKNRINIEKNMPTKQLIFSNDENVTSID